MNDLDDWLNSLGFDNNSPALESAVVPVPSALTSPVLSTETEPHPQAESPVSNISPDDFNDILADNGFQEPAYEEAEEVNEEDEEENDENMDLYYSKIASAMYNELYPYSDNEYITSYMEILTRYMYE